MLNWCRISTSWKLVVKFWFLTQKDEDVLLFSHQTSSMNHHLTETHEQNFEIHNIVFSSQSISLSIDRVECRNFELAWCQETRPISPPTGVDRSDSHRPSWQYCPCGQRTSWYNPSWIPAVPYCGVNRRASRLLSLPSLPTDGVACGYMAVAMSTGTVTEDGDPTL